MVVVVVVSDEERYRWERGRRVELGERKGQKRPERWQRAFICMRRYDVGAGWLGQVPGQARTAPWVTWQQHGLGEEGHAIRGTPHAKVRYSSTGST